MATVNLDSLSFTKDDERDALAAHVDEIDTSDSDMSFDDFIELMSSPYCPSCKHDPHPGEQCPAWFSEENLPCCGCTGPDDDESSPDPADGCTICDRADHLATDCPERVPGTSDAQPTPTPKEVVMDFAYKADLIYEIMVTQRNEPTTFVPKIADSVPSQCRRCAGTGRYITGTLNGVPVGPGGPCYRCAGKGFQTKADQRRNWGYDNFGQRVAVGPAPTIVAVHDGFPCPHCGATKDHTVEACGL